MSCLEIPSLRKPGLDTRRSGHERGTRPPCPALEAQGTFPHSRTPGSIRPARLKLPARCAVTTIGKARLPVKTVRFHQYYATDLLHYEDVQVPVPGPAEVRIRVASTAFIDDFGAAAASER